MMTWAGEPVLTTGCIYPVYKKVYGCMRICWTVLQCTRPGGYLHVIGMHSGMCRPNVLVFHHKSSDKGPIFSQKPLEEGPISPKFRKKKTKAKKRQQQNCKISR